MLKNSFVCITQIQRIQLFNAPSGARYTSYAGQPFLVDNDVDAEFFASFPKRFSATNKVVINDDIKQATDSAETKLLDFLIGFEDVTDETVELVCDAYKSLDGLREDVVAGVALDAQIGISKRQLNILRKIFAENKKVVDDKEDNKDGD